MFPPLSRKKKLQNEENTKRNKTWREQVQFGEYLKHRTTDRNPLTNAQPPDGPIDGFFYAHPTTSTLLGGVSRAAVSIYLFYCSRAGVGGYRPGFDRNDLVRRLPPFVGCRRRRGHHATGVIFARPPMPCSAASHAPFSRNSLFFTP
jgi:hypothetical protein